MGDLEKHLNTRCDSPPHRADFLKHTQCFKDQAKADAIRLCADKHMVMLEKVSSLPKELKLGGACCSAHALRECAIGKITEMCSGETGDYFNDMISEVVCFSSSWLLLIPSHLSFTGWGEYWIGVSTIHLTGYVQLQIQRWNLERAQSNNGLWRSSNGNSSPLQNYCAHCGQNAQRRIEGGEWDPFGWALT